MKRFLFLIIVLGLAMILSNCSNKSETIKETTPNIITSDVENNEEVQSPSTNGISTESSITICADSENSNTSNLGSDNTNKPIDKIETIPEQSFWTDLDNYGKVKFVSGYHMDMGIPVLDLYLADSNDNKIYVLPNLYGNLWEFYEMKAVSFKDVNNDGLKDIIVIADYILGHGDNAAVSFPVAGIYFQKGKEFVNILDLDTEINDAKQNESISMVVKYIEGKDLEDYGFPKQ